MEETVLIYVLVFVVFLLCIYAKSVFDRKKRKTAFYNRMKSQWGQASKRQYSPEEIQRISNYFALKDAEDFFIDDITWKDLDFQKIYEQMNHSCSSIGDEYLYYLLRTPSFDLEELKRRQSFEHFFRENEEERLLVQEIFGNIGRIREISVIGYLKQFEELPVRHWARYLLRQAVLLLSIVLIFIIPAAGICATIASLCWNIITYFREKREIEVYLTGFSYINNLIKKARLFEKIQSPFLKPYTHQILQKADKLKKFCRGSFLLKSGNDFSGGLEDVLLDYLRVLFHLDLQQFNRMLKELYVHEEELMELYEWMGYLESMLSFSSYGVFLGHGCVPVFTDKKYIRAKEVYHPLIEEPVKNSIETEKGVLLTGSNASGKSTFLRTVAINCILAQTVYVTAAEEFMLPFGKVFSSMALQDSLENQESYFIVEVKSLKRILDAVGSIPVICFIDEVLRGTNTPERVAASTEILDSLVEENVISFAATHDIELTYLLEERYDNYHFTETIEKKQVIFDYCLKPGRAVSRNAITLLEVLGFEHQIIENANKRVERFLKDNVW